jgi:hypothetical protein
MTRFVVSLKSPRFRAKTAVPNTLNILIFSPRRSSARVRSDRTLRLRRMAAICAIPPSPRRVARCAHRHVLGSGDDHHPLVRLIAIFLYHKSSCLKNLKTVTLSPRHPMILNIVIGPSSISQPYLTPVGESIRSVRHRCFSCLNVSINPIVEYCI